MTLHVSSSSVSVVCSALLWLCLYFCAGPVLSQPEILETDCPRIRKAWHLLSPAEKQLAKEGFLDLRNSENPALDKLLIVANVHQDPFYTGLIHESSASYFWHGYLVWEIETQIRALDADKYGCWAMPYYDYTVDYGREAHASILTELTATFTGDDDATESTAIETGYFGGYGNPDDFYAVNDYSWPHVSAEDWSTGGCCEASVDTAQDCSIKRRRPADDAQGSFFLSARQLRAFFHDGAYAHFEDYMYGYPFNTVLAFLTQGAVAGDGDSSAVCQCTTICGSSQGYDPLWWLLHSFAQYHLSLWMNCADNGYTTAAALTNGVTKDADDQDSNAEMNDDGSNVGGLGGAAFQEYFNEDRAASLIADRRAIDPTLDMNDYKFGLDDLLYFPGISDEAWSYTHAHALTIRQLYDISKWNIQYDVGTFYAESGVDEFCDASKMNADWFIGLNKHHKNENKNQNQEEKSVHQKHSSSRASSSVFGISLSSSSSSLYINFMMVLIFAGVSVVVLGVYYCWVGRCGRRDSKQIDIDSNRSSSSYGSTTPL